MRVLLLTHDTTAPPELVAALEALGYEVLTGTGAPAVVGGESGPVALAFGSGLESAVALSERAHRESEERYRSLFDGVPVGLYRTTPKGDFLDANDALVRILGYPARDSILAAHTADMYLDPEDRLRWQRAVETLGTAQTVEVRMRRLDGAVIWGRF